MGSAKFKHSLLARHGQVVVIPHYKLSREGVKAKLEAAIGVPLHQAFEVCTNRSTGLLPQQALSCNHSTALHWASPAADVGDIQH